MAHVSHKSIIPLPQVVGQNTLVQMYEHSLAPFLSPLSHCSRSVFFSQSQQYGLSLSTINSHFFEHIQSLPFLSPLSHCSPASRIPFQQEAVHSPTSSGQFKHVSASSIIQFQHFAVHAQTSLGHVWQSSHSSIFLFQHLSNFLHFLSQFLLTPFHLQSSHSSPSSRIQFQHTFLAIHLSPRSAAHDWQVSFF